MYDSELVSDGWSYLLTPGRAGQNPAKQPLAARLPGFFGWKNILGHQATKGNLHIGNIPYLLTI